MFLFCFFFLKGLFIMMAFCKKSVHSFLSLSNPLLHIDTNNYTTCSGTNCRVVSHEEKPLPPPPGGLGLITGETQKVPNVLEAAAVKKERDHPMPASSLYSPGKKDPGGIGFIDDIGGGVDGLMSCTESLGFESCDERRADDEMLELSSGDSAARTVSKVIKRRKVGERRDVKNFPPPLSSLNPNGQPCFFLRPLRRDGRLELTEVRIDRPEILRACREGGRLRLRLIRDEEEAEEEEEGGEEDQLSLDNNNNNNNHDHNDNIVEEGISLELQDNEEKDGFDEDEKSEEESRVSPATNTVINNNGESSVRRCHEDAVAVGHVHHHHRGHHQRHGNHRNDHLHVWSQQCVTTCR